MTEKLYEQFSLTSIQIGFSSPLLILGIAGLFSPESFIGILIISLWLSIATKRNGAEIDYEVRQINFYNRILGIKLDSWQRLEKYRAYIIRRQVRSAHYVSRYQEQTFHTEKTILALIKNDPKDFKIIKVDRKENLISFGLQFEEKTGIRRHVTKSKF